MFLTVDLIFSFDGEIQAYVVYRLRVCACQLKICNTYIREQRDHYDVRTGMEQTLDRYLNGKEEQFNEGNTIAGR